MLYQWLYNPTIKTSTVGIVIETLGNVKITSHYHSLHLLLYEKLNIFPQLWADFLECQKCNIPVIMKELRQELARKKKAGEKTFLYVEARL